jgi:hypothetical protein
MGRGTHGRCRSGLTAFGTSVRAVARELVRSVALYGAAAARVAPRRRRTKARPGDADRLVFVVGSPRSGTTFLGTSLGAHPELVDLGELQPLKAAIPRLSEVTTAEAARELHRIVERVRLLAGLRRVRAVEQTPETSFVAAAVLEAYPRATLVHIVRDGRDVAASLLERGWLSAGRGGRDDAHAAYGAHARFWVEPERRAEFERASDATRAAWAWRRYVSAAREPETDRRLEVRYEQLLTEPAAVAEVLGAALGLDPAPLATALARAHSRSIGNWRRRSAQELADIEREAGALLRELRYV